MCAFCGQPAERPARDPGRFCSPLCASQGQRIHAGKRQRKVPCPGCDGLKSESAQMCNDCRRRTQRDKSSARTLQDIRNIASSVYTFHATVRGLARNLYSGPMACVACGYTLHVDIAHIAPVSSFSMDTPLSVVNAPSNLVALDKRCHWEFDHGYLAL